MAMKLARNFLMVCVDISGVRALIRTLRNIEKTIAKQVFSSMVNEDDDLVKSIFLDN